MVTSTNVLLSAYFCRGQALFSSSNTLPSRAAAQTPLHKMYTFVYRTFIKFILFCRGQALDVFASNAVVNSLFDRISTRRIVHPLLDARTDTNVVKTVSFWILLIFSLSTHWTPASTYQMIRTALPFMSTRNTECIHIIFCSNIVHCNNSAIALL